MPQFEDEILANGGEEELEFPPVSRQHILNCSYDQWFPKYVDVLCSMYRTLYR
jgi:hypothetical protein